MSNNPPDFVLELTQEEAEFLMRNCKANLHYSLTAMTKLQEMDARRSSFEKLVEHTENFKTISDKLKKAGVPDAD